MPAPLVAAGIPILAKAGALLKGLSGVGTVAKGAAGAGAFAKGAAARGAVGKGLQAYMGPVTPGNLAMNFGFDGAFGVMAGMNTEGDIMDKIIAGTAVGASGALGGMGATLGVGKLTGKVPEGGMRMLTEMGGAMLGDEVGFRASDAILRAKGGGTTPMEKTMAVEGDAYKAQLEQELMRKYGIYPGIPTYNAHDPFMASNGIG